MYINIHFFMYTESITAKKLKGELCLIKIEAPTDTDCTSLGELVPPCVTWANPELDLLVSAAGSEIWNPKLVLIHGVGFIQG